MRNSNASNAIWVNKTYKSEGALCLSSFDQLESTPQAFLQTPILLFTAPLALKTPKSVHNENY
jgi:hypothetical protein